MMRAVLLGLVFCLGCSATVSPRPVALSSNAPARPFLIHVPGIGGLCQIDHTLREGLVRGGFDGDFEFFDWTGEERGIPALHNGPRNREQARLLSQKILEHVRRSPGQPVYITSHSGGAGIAVWALEDLPPEVKIECLVMLGPAMSPGYDLTRALAHVRTRAINFFSSRDTLILGSGTRWLGTIDGKRIESAGKVGFAPPPSADPAQYKKLQQRAYDPAWARLGNNGGHMGWMTTAFGRGVVAPLMWGREPTEADFEAAGIGVAPAEPDGWLWQ